MKDIKYLTYLSRAFHLLDSTREYSWKIVDGKEYITIQLFNSSIVTAQLPIEDAIKLLEERLIQLKQAGELYKKFKKARD